MLQELINKYQKLSYLIVSGNLSILKEENHLMPNIDNYFNRLVSWLTPQLKDGENKFVITEKVFDGLDVFFEKLKIDLTINLINNNIVSQHSTTTPQIDTTLNESGKLRTLDLKIQITSDRLHLFLVLASAFYHEMLHGYEDWNRIKKLNGLNCLMSYNLASNYHNLNKINSSGINGSNELFEILYNISQIEQRAYFQSCIGEYKEMLKLYPQLQNQPMEKVIKILPSYKNYIKLDTCLGRLKNINDIGNQNQLLKLFNDNSGIIGYADKKYLLNKAFSPHFEIGHKNDYKIYKIKTYIGLLSFLEGKIENAQNKFVEKISKLQENQLINNIYKIF